MPRKLSQKMIPGIITKENRGVSHTSKTSKKNSKPGIETTKEL